GICVTDKPGIRIRKPMLECTREEIEEEAWAQVLACGGLEAVARPEGGGSLRDVKVVGFHMWDSFALKDGRMQTWEPRWTNNVGTLRPRPVQKTRLANFVLSGGYTRTGMEIFCMEGACESGKRAAAAVVEAAGNGVAPVRVGSHPR